MKRKKNLENQWLKKYLNVAPVSLAIVRAEECRLLCRSKFKHPILDIGCGDGVFASVFFKGQIDEGIDILPKEISSAKSKGTHKNLRLANAANLPYKDGSFKTVFSNCVLEHIPQIDDALKEVSRVLKPNGKLIFTVPSGEYGKNIFFSSFFSEIGLDSLGKLYAQKINSYCRHYNLHTPKVWEEKLERIGLKMVSCETYLSPNATKIHDLLLTFSLFSMINKRIFGKMILFPRFRRLVVVPAIFPVIRKFCEPNPKKGSSLLIIAEKPNLKDYDKKGNA